MNQTELDNFLKCFLQVDDPLSHMTENVKVNHIEAHGHQHNHYGDHRHEHELDHDDETGEVLVIAKVTAMVVLFVASTLCGSVPFLLDRCIHWTENQTNARSATVIKCLLYFGGGVLLATTFLHLLPEVQELVLSLQDCSLLPELSFPLAEMLMCSGFFLMYFVEEAIHAYIHRNQSHDKSDAVAAFERGHSIRNSHLLRKPTAPPVDESNLGEKELQMISALTTISVSDLRQKQVENQKFQKASMHTCNEVFQQQPNTNNHSHHHHHHSHSHLPDNDESSDMLASSLRGLFIVLALSLHELFEGMTIGLEHSANSVWFMFGAVSAHKLVLAFCVGVELIVARTRVGLSIVYVLTFAIVSPLGIGVGILISHDSSGPSLISATLQGFACGTLLYVVFFEILSKNRAGLRAYLALFIGFLVMFGLQQLGTNGSHGHSHGNSCGNNGRHDHDHDHNYDHGDEDDENHQEKSNEVHHLKNSRNNYEQQLRLLRQITQRLLEKPPQKRYSEVKS